jgi:hypothetical protein
MTNHDDSQTEILELDSIELHSVVGGADFNAIRRKAQQHCPETAQRYAGVDPGSVTRPEAQQMGAACLAEMGPFKASFARPVIERAIDAAFPQTR